MKVWIRKNEGQVCEVFQGLEQPKDCEAPGKWSQVESDSKFVVEFYAQMQATIDRHNKIQAKQARIMALMLDPSIEFEKERQKILAEK